MPFSSKTLIAGPHAGGGYLDVTLVAELTNGAASQPEFARRIPFDASGFASIDVVANDDVGTTPTGTYYRIDITTKAGRRSFPFVVPAGSASPIDLDTVVPSPIGEIGRPGATKAEFDGHTGLSTTAHGGIVAGTDTRLTDARTPKGPAGGHLAGTYPDPTLAVVPAGRRRGASAQGVSDALDTKITFGANVYDVGGVAIAGNNHLIAARAGVWLVVYNLRWNTNAGTGNNVVAAWVLLNGAGDRHALSEGLAVATQRPTQTGSALVRAALNDTFQLWVFQSSGAARSTDLVFGLPYLEAAWIGP